MARELREEDKKAGDELSAFLEREVILLAGEQGSGKSYSVVKLIQDGLEQGFNVIVVDRDRGLAKAIREVFGRKVPDNLDYFLADSWEKIPRAVSHAFDVLGAGDWFVSEMVGRFWDFAQTEYSRRVYGEELSEHLLALRADAQRLIQEAGLDLRSKDEKKRKEAQKQVAQAMQYSGLEGRTDWSVIKRMHNDDVFDRLMLHGDFNMLSTTSLSAVSNEELQKNAWEMFHNLGKRPEGEKHQVYRHDTIAVCYKKGSKFFWRTDLGNGKGKDRGRALVRDVEFGDADDPDMSVGFIASYMEYHAEEE